MKERKLDVGYGAAELAADDPLVNEAYLLGWKIFEEGFNDGDGVFRRDDGEEFTMSGSQTDHMVVVYDSRWRLA